MARPSLIERVGTLEKLYTENCLPSAWMFISFLGPAFIKLLWSLLPFDQKGEYHFATGESWVCTEKRLMREATNQSPNFAGTKSAAWNLIEQADKNAWRSFVASVAAEGFINWTSMAMRNSPCRGGHAGWAASVLWALPPGSGPGAGLWLDQYDPDAWFGINSLHIPANYEPTSIAVCPFFIPLTPIPLVSWELRAFPDDPNRDPPHQTVFGLSNITPDDPSNPTGEAMFAPHYQKPKGWQGTGCTYEVIWRNDGNGIALSIPGCPWVWSAARIA